MRVHAPVQERKSIPNLVVLEHRLQLNGVIIRGNSSNISLQDAFVTIFD